MAQKRLVLCSSAWATFDVPPECCCSLEASNALINRCAEHLSANLATYAREGKETNIWRDFGAHTTCT